MKGGRLHKDGGAETNWRCTRRGRESEAEATVGGGEGPQLNLLGLLGCFL